jgi:hypothetical protein
MADVQDVDATARALVTAVVDQLRQHERAVRLRPTEWMQLMQSGGQTVMGLPDYQRLEDGLAQAFPDRFGGPLGSHELPSQFIWALVDAAVLRAASYYDFELPPAAIDATVAEMFDLIHRDRDRVVAARVISDITVDKPFYAGRVELRPTGSWGLNEAYRDIDGIIPGAGRLLDEVANRTGPSFTYTTLRTDADAALGDRIFEGYGVARRLALGRLETLTAALRLATASTAQVVVDIDSAPGHARLMKPQVLRHDTDFMEIAQRIGHVRPEHASALANLGDRLASWGGDDANPHSLGVALGRFNRSFVTRPWFDTLVDLAVGLEAALLGGADHEEIGLRLRSRAAALLATATDPPLTIYEDVKRLYNLRSMVVHGSSPTTARLEAQAYQISVAARTHRRGEKWALILDRSRDLLRRAILARGFLTDAGRWPTRGREAERFDVDALLVDSVSRESLRETWRGALAEIGLPVGADEATPASLMVELPDHARGPMGVPVDEGSAPEVDPNADPNRPAD